MDDWHKAHRKELNAYNREWNRKHKRNVAAWKRRYAKRHPERVKATLRKYFDKLRADVLLAYGGKCALCPQTEHLTIDHINGDGAEHRKRKHRHWAAIWADVRREGYPKDKYRLLCRSCNTREWYRLFWKGPRRVVTCPKCGHEF